MDTEIATTSPTVTTVPPLTAPDGKLSRLPAVEIVLTSSSDVLQERFPIVCGTFREAMHTLRWIQQKWMRDDAAAVFGSRGSARLISPKIVTRMGLPMTTKIGYVVKYADGWMFAGQIEIARWDEVPSIATNMRDRVRHLAGFNRLHLSEKQYVEVLAIYGRAMREKHAAILDRYAIGDPKASATRRKTATPVRPSMTKKVKATF